MADLRPRACEAARAEYVAGGGSTTVVYKTTNAPNRVAFAEFLQAQMAAIGITVQPQFFDLAQYSSSVVQSQDFQMAGSVGGPVDSPYPAAQNLLRTGGNPNYGGYTNPEMDALLDQAAATTDEAERTRLYQQVQLVANQDLSMAFYSRGYLSTIAKPEVKGVVRYLTRTCSSPPPGSTGDGGRPRRAPTREFDDDPHTCARHGSGRPDRRVAGRRPPAASGLRDSGLARRGGAHAPRGHRRDDARSRPVLAQDPY